MRPKNVLCGSGKYGAPSRPLIARSLAAPPGFMTWTAFLPLNACVVSTDTVPPEACVSFQGPPGAPGAAYESKSSQYSAVAQGPVVGPPSEPDAPASDTTSVAASPV